MPLFNFEFRKASEIIMFQPSLGFMNNSMPLRLSPLYTHTNRKTKTTDRNTHTHTHIREGWWFALPLVLRLPERCWANGGVPNPLSVRNTSLNPNVWRAKSFFQLGPARLASIDYVTLGKSSIKSSNRSLEEKVSISFFFSCWNSKAAADTIPASSALSCHG